MFMLNRIVGELICIYKVKEVKDLGGYLCVKNFKFVVRI